MTSTGGVVTTAGTAAGGQAPSGGSAGASSAGASSAGSGGGTGLYQGPFSCTMYIGAYLSMEWWNAGFQTDGVDDAKWQLVEKPLSRGEFLRQPALTPLFFASGLELIAPDRSQVDVQGKLDILLKNPQNVFLTARYEEPGSRREPERCVVQDGPSPRISCDFNRAGRYDVMLFTNRSSTGIFDFAGQLQVNAN